MKKTIITALLTLCVALSAHCAIDKGAASALVTITTTDASNKTIGTTTGFAVAMTNADGTTTTEIIATYKPFRGATAATVSAGKNKSTNAHRITGANDLYDIVRFNTVEPAAQPLHIATGKLAVGTKAFILHPADTKNSVLQQVTIDEATESGGLSYYTMNSAYSNAYVGCPLLNENGEVVGVIQQNATGETAHVYAIGIEFNSALEIGTMSSADPALNNIHIAKQLPADKDQAASYLYLLTKNSTDTLSYLTNLQDFIEAYPTSTFGYTERATYYASSEQFALAEADYNKALEVCDDKADVHHNMSLMMYRLNQRTAYKVYKDWTLERALSEAEQAYAINQSPLYLSQQGKCLYGLKRYMDAYKIYGQINQTKFRSSENLFYQSRSLEMAGGDSTEILALLDSAVERFIRPLRGDAAPYIYYRAQQNHRYGFYAKAYFDYQDYEQLVGDANLNEVFFFNK